MKQNQKIMLVISLGLVILLNILLLSWLLTDFFSDPHEPVETVAATGGVEETTDKESTASGETSTENPTTAESTTEEPTTEEPTTEEPTTEEPTTEEPTTEEQPTREPTPYDEVLEEYFAKWTQLYMDETDTGFNTERWAFLQSYITQYNETMKCLRADAEIEEIEVLAETEKETKLHVTISNDILFMAVGASTYYNPALDEFIVRLENNDGNYNISSVSFFDLRRCYHKELTFEMGIEEDLNLLKQSNSTAKGLISGDSLPGEPTPYEDVLNAYFAKWAQLYLDEEDSGFDSKRWAFIQKTYKEQLGQIFLDSEATVAKVELMDETEEEIRLFVTTYHDLSYTYGSEKTYNQKDSYEFIIRLTKQTDGYQISSVSHCDWMRPFEMGIEEDLKWLRRPRGSETGAG